MATDTTDIKSRVMARLAEGLTPERKARLEQRTSRMKERIATRKARIQPATAATNLPAINIGDLNNLNLSALVEQIISRLPTDQQQVIRDQITPALAAAQTRLDEARANWSQMAQQHAHDLTGAMIPPMGAGGLASHLSGILTRAQNPAPRQAPTSEQIGAYVGQRQAGARTPPPWAGGWTPQTPAQTPPTTPGANLTPEALAAMLARKRNVMG